MEMTALRSVGARMVPHVITLMEYVTVLLAGLVQSVEKVSYLILEDPMAHF